MVLTLYSEIDCKGQSAVVRDKEVNLTKAGVSFKVKVCSKQISYLRNTCIVMFKFTKSAVVEGNPWILFSTERFQEFLCFLEDGRHEDLMSHGLPDNYRVASAKLKTESLANPHIVLYNSSSFKGIL